jgi:ketosteroid isomerase-like protein
MSCLVQIVEQLGDAWNRSDWDFAEDWFLPDADAIAPEGWPEAEDAQGWPGIRRQFERLNEPWEESHWEPQTTEPVGDETVMQYGRWRVRGHGSGIEVEAEFWIIFRFRGQKVRRVEFYPDHDQAMVAVKG